MNETFGKIKGKKGNALSSLFLLLNNTNKNADPISSVPGSQNISILRDDRKRIILSSRSQFAAPLEILTHHIRACV